MITRRALYLLLLAAPIVALATLARELIWLAVAYIAIIGLLLIADYALSPKPNQFRLKRVNDAKLSLGADNLIRVVIRRVDGDVSGVAENNRTIFGAGLPLASILLPSVSRLIMARGMIGG